MRLFSSFLLSSVDLAAFEAFGANVSVFHGAVRVDHLDLLDVHAPAPSVFAVGVAHFVTAELTFIADAAYPRHTFTSVYVADI